MDKSRFGLDSSTRYSVVSVSNTGLVDAYIKGYTCCSGGGYTLVILKLSGSSYKVDSKILSVHTPIIELGKTSNGLPEFGVWVRYGGIEIGYEAVLTANQNGKYPVSAVVVKDRTPIKSGKMLIRVGDQGAALLQ